MKRCIRWRTRFLNLRAAITPGLRAEHSQRIASRELAEEFTGLIEELEFEHEGETINAVRTGHAYGDAHSTAFAQYVNGQWDAAMRNISPTLIRAIRLKLLLLRLNDQGRHTDPQHEEPEVILARKIGKLLADKAQDARLDMNAEPLLSEMGIYRPALTGVVMRLYNSPCAMHLLVQGRKEKLERKQQKESQA